MIRHVWSVLCGQSSVDKDSNSVSLLGVIEELQVTAVVIREPIAETLPMPIRHEVVSLWIRSAGDADGLARLALAGPDADEQLAFNEFELAFQGRDRLRTRLQSATMPIRGSGQYWYTLALQEPEGNWTEVARIPLVITITFQIRPEVQAAN